MATKSYKQPSKVAQPDVGAPYKKPQSPNWVPMDGVDINTGFPAKKPGIKTRGNGAATKGTKAYGPMA